MSADRIHLLRQLLEERILILDGAMGTMIQSHRLDTHQYHGDLFHDHACDQKGNNDLLTLTQPQIIRGIHTGYLEAGADILETNTFNSTRISMADYGMEDAVPELNLQGARLAREAADEWTKRTPQRPRFVAGVLGPTNRTASISPDVNDPGARNVSFDELVAVYREAVDGLVQGGADLLLVETIFDTLNAKAAIFAIEDWFERHGAWLPVMISGTITDRSGRTLSGQTVGAFWSSVSHARPFSVGLNCALGAKDLRPHIEELAASADTHTSLHPNAGLPNEMGEYDESPEYMASVLREFAQAGFLNIVGGCCGTTPAHIRAIAEAVQGCAPRQVPKPGKKLRLSGLEPLNIGADSLFVNVGERTNVTGSKAFARLILSGNYAASAGGRPPAGGERRADHRREHGRGHARFAAGHGHVPEAGRFRAGHLARADHDRLQQVERDRGRLEVRAGQVGGQLDQPEGGRRAVPAPGQAGAPLRCRGSRHGVRRAGPGRHPAAPHRDLHPRLPSAHQGSGLSARGHHLRPQHLRGGHRDRRAQPLRDRLHRGHPRRSSARCRMPA